MTNHRSAALVLTGLLAAGTVVVAAPAIPAAEPASASAPAPIRLIAGDFIPGGGSLPAVPAGLGARPVGEHSQAIFLVRFRGPVIEEWTDELAGVGADILEYLPDYAFKVRMTPAQARRAERLAAVTWVGRFQPAWKLSGEAKRKIDAGKPVLYRVRTEPGSDLAAVRGEVTRTGSVVARANGNTIMLIGGGTQAAQVATIDEVAYIEPYVAPEKHNENAAGVLMRGNQANARGYDGSTQIVGMADSGLGGGTAATGHPDIAASRITVHDWPGRDLEDCWVAEPDGARDVDSGHGTHTAVSAVGGGDANGLGKAAANKARLVFQSVEDWTRVIGHCTYMPDGYSLAGLPDDLAELYQQAYDDGARIHSNSWGIASYGEYGAFSSDTDRFADTHRDMLLTFSAGNSGVDFDTDGKIDGKLIYVPATGKNVLAVGASENKRPAFRCDTNMTYVSQEARERTTWGGRSCKQLGGNLSPLPTWGAWYPENYPVEPFKSDPQADNDQEVAPFSSRGPAADGRIKPDVVAPGSWVLSGYSGEYQRGYDAAPNPKNKAWQDDGIGYPAGSKYKYFSGTSMSNPLAAGGAAVVRDFYHKKHGWTKASAALVKGTLINSAEDLLDENVDGSNDNDFPIPNMHEGWGRINLERATAGTARFTDENVGLATGSTTEASYQVAAARPLKVTMAYTDVEGSYSAAVSLVNDLDLELVAPNGTVYRGNVFTGGWSTTGGTADRRNNVENVYVKAPAPGVWKIRVRGHNVPRGPQNFALVVSGSFGTPSANVAPDVGNPGPQRTLAGSPVSLQVRASDLNGDILTYAATGLPAGLSIARATGVITGKPTTKGVWAVTVTVSDGKGGTGRAAFGWTVHIPAQQLLANPGFEAGAANWSGTTAVIGQQQPKFPAHTGTWLATLGGKGARSSHQVRQPVSIPATAASAKLSFWYQISTEESFVPEPVDFLRVQVLDTGGAVLATLATLSNMNNAYGYRQKTVDLSAYKGKTIQVRLLSTEDEIDATTFRIDDVTVDVP